MASLYRRIGIIAATSMMVVVALLSANWVGASALGANFGHTPCLGTKLAAVATMDSTIGESGVFTTDRSMTSLVNVPSQPDNGSGAFTDNDCCNSAVCALFATTALLLADRAALVVSSVESVSMGDRAMPVDPRPPRPLV